LEASATVTKEFVARAEQLCRLECAEASSYRSVSLNINRKVKKSLTSDRDVLTTEAFYLIHKVALENVMHPSPWFLLLSLFMITVQNACMVPMVLLALPFSVRVMLPPQSLLDMVHNVVQKELHEFMGILVLRIAEQIISLSQFS